MGLTQDTFKEWSKQRREEMKQFHEQRDREFHQFLKQRWEEMKVFKGMREDTVPKPDEFPLAKENEKVPTKKIAEVEQPDTYNAFRNKETGVEKDSRDRPTNKFDNSAVPPNKTGNVQFLGQKFSIKKPKGYDNITVDQVTSSEVAQFWKNFAGLELDFLITSLEERRNQLNVKGWGYVMMVHEVARAFSPDNPRKRILTTWSLLLKSGADVRMGHDRESYYLLYHSPVKLMGTPYFQFNGDRYYVFQREGHSQSIRQLYTYQDQYSGPRKPIQPGLASEPRVRSNYRTRELTFQYNGQQYTVKAQVDQTMVNYFNSLPQMKLQEYIKDLPGAGVKASFIRQLRTMTSDMKKREKLRFLLRFAQSAFEYKTDQDQFGNEKYMVPAQTIFYPYSDCEDRSMLFMWIVKKV
ncbi:MAG: hypothetical protein ABEJ65_00885, partial [bacterium]